MSFYLKPPRGQINLHKLEECVTQRLSIYDNINQLENISLRNFDCVIEDSGLDRTGHFLFRIQAIYNSSFKDIFIHKECELLKLRLECYEDTDFRRFIKKLSQKSRELLKSEEFSDGLKQFIISLIELCSKMLEKNYVVHLKQHSNKTECKQILFNINYNICPLLLTKNEFSLRNGYLQVPCCAKIKLFHALFNRFLILAINEMKNGIGVFHILQDTRIKNVLSLINNHYFTNCNKSSLFKIKDIENESKFFPLCMQALFQNLKKNNRLSHNARYDFSLFLKCLGASVLESIKFWELIYSKKHASCSTCTHSWQENERKYVYGIRHMYGLEGARKNYEMRTCQYYQNLSLCARDEGGCPFRHFDDHNLRRTLNNILPSTDEMEVIIHERKGSPNEACKLTFQSLYKQFTTEEINLSDVFFANPVQYFELLKKSQF
ncbi:uncharacterized protein LOC109594075 isoform X2 [Aethina tumida]|uniref:uncharacterized protein LOC109594075 isoform X2 n=1 Tax=Aethina tumida TaxID=116153 RepID=UPI002148C9CA|nr:uncharacterized protein LOC109594075 isoform X2 [Aethina tumida]